MADFGRLAGHGVDKIDEIMETCGFESSLRGAQVRVSYGSTLGPLWKGLKALSFHNLVNFIDAMPSQNHLRFQQTDSKCYLSY